MSPGPVGTWRTAAEIALWRHGWAWPLAGLLALGAAAAHFAALLPARRAHASAMAELAAQQRQQQHPRLEHDGAATAASSEPQRRMQAAQALLRASPDAPQLVRRMAALAQAERISMPQGDYQLHQLAAGVWRLQLMQTVQVSYPQLRRYAQSVLAELPNASLDQIQARRDSVGQTQIEARLKWSLWTGKAPGEPAPARLDAGAVAEPQAVAASAGRDLFSARNWTPPAPTMPALPPPAPTAPPLPFAFLGKKQEDGVWEIYLSRAEQTYIVREGGTLDGSWRVDTIAPPRLQLTYLPLGQAQTLSIGDAR